MALERVGTLDPLKKSGLSVFSWPVRIAQRAHDAIHAGNRSYGGVSQKVGVMGYIGILDRGVTRAYCFSKLRS